MKKILIIAMILFSLNAQAQDYLVKKYAIISDSLARAMVGKIGRNNYKWPDTLTDIYNRNIVESVYGLYFDCFPDSGTIVKLTDDKVHFPKPVITNTVTPH